MDNFFADLQEGVFVVLGPSLNYLFAAFLGGIILLVIVVNGIGVVRRFNR
jgi:hypothetical protein